MLQILYKSKYVKNNFKIQADKSHRFSQTKKNCHSRPAWAGVSGIY